MRPHYSTLLKDILHRTVGKTAAAFSPPVKKFIILSSGRAGSNLLVSLMKSHPGIFQHSEILGEFQLESQLIRRRISKVGVNAYLDRRLSRIGFEKAIGLKLLYGNLEARYGEVRGVPGVEHLLEHVLKNPNIRVIHLRREDKLALLVSIRLANELRQWVSGGYGDTTIEMPVEWVTQKFEWLEAWEARIAQLFPASRLHQMTYEQLAGNTETEMRRLFSFLDLEPAETQSRMSKQNKRTKSEIIENFEELRSAFSGSRFAPLFDIP